MKHATLRFYAELNDFLPACKAMVSFAYAFDVSGAVKDVIESCGSRSISRTASGTATGSASIPYSSPSTSRL